MLQAHIKSCLVGYTSFCSLVLSYLLDNSNVSDSVDRAGIALVMDKDGV